MLEFGVEVSTAELIALERALRGLDTDEARSALAKAHRTPVLLTAKEREAVLSALGALRDAPGVADNYGEGLARLAHRLEREQETAPDEPPPPKPRSRRT
jgi:hypothetical protein